MKKKVLFFIQESIGGAERITILIAKMLDLAKFDVVFAIVPYSEVSNSVRDFIPDSYKCVYIDRVSPIKKMWQMFRVIRQQKPDIVFSSVFHLSNKILPFRLFFLRTKFILRCENYLFTFKKHQLLQMFVLYRLASSIIAQTKEMGDELVRNLKICQKKIVVLENPIDSETILSKIKDGSNPFPNNGRKHIVASGRFCFQKGFDLLIKAFAELKKKNENVDLYVIGANDGEYVGDFNNVMGLAKKLGIEQDFHCVGYQSNPYVYVKNADCFALSSRWEGLPNVLIESLYLGTPVAAFKCIPIIERIVTDGKNGFLAPKEDWKALAEAMDKCLKLNNVDFDYRGASDEEFVRLFL